MVKFLTNAHGPYCTVSRHIGDCLDTIQKNEDLEEGVFQALKSILMSKTTPILLYAI